MPVKSKQKVKDPTFGNIAFGDNDGMRKLQKAKVAEPDTKKEKNIYTGLNKWTATRQSGIGLLLKYKSDIIAAADKFPRILKPKKPTGTLVYRGVKSPSKQLMQTLSKTSPKYWSMLKSEDDIWVYEKPISYSPRSEIQSFTYDLYTAKDFGNQGSNDIIVITKQDTDYYINSDALAILYGDNEYEVLHFGKTFKKPVYISIGNELYRDIFTQKSKYTTLSGFAKKLK
jgi:hypothetical protein